jgi:hypothetical protein
VKPSPNLFQKWSRAPYWGPEEGVALAFGLDPAEVVEARQYGHPRLKAADPAPHFAGLARRAVSQGDLEEEAQPSAFLDWAEGVGLAFHDNWTSTLNPRVPAGPEGELETVGETMTRVSEFVERRDELIRNWALAPTWTLEEGACLANNLSPRLMLGRDSFPRPHPAADSVNRLLEFALRARRQRQISSHPTPAEFIAWSEGVGFPFDAKWLKTIGEPRVDDGPAIREAMDSISTPNPAAEPTQAPPIPEQEPGTRTRETMLKIIIGLAVDGHGYDPRSRRSEVPGSVAKELSALGIPVTAETVRKYLDEGAKLLSPSALKNRFRDD